MGINESGFSLTKAALDALGDGPTGANAWAKAPLKFADKLNRNS
jgi:hypothetical protein